ncbi:MAG: branched-chain amino acid ABC transporter permease [Patescibacteria group bacterium]
MRQKNANTGKNQRMLLGLVSAFAVLEILVWLKALNEYWTLVIISLCINIILAVSLNLINGFTGQFSLGHAGFMAIGGYTAAVIALKLTSPWIEAGAFPSLANVRLGMPLGLPALYLPFAKAILPGGLILAFSLVLGGCLAALMGFVIGLPTLRLRGDYLAIATLGFGEIIRLSILNIEYLGGATGMPQIPQYTTLFGCFLLAALTVILIRNLIGSTHGRAMMAVREDEIAAEAMGINTTWYKVAAFTIGAFFAGVAGALYAHTYYLVNPKSFTFVKTIDVLVMVVLGGMGSIWGSIGGAILVTIINAYLSNFPTIRMVIFAIFLVVVMIFLPRGLLSLKGLFNWRQTAKAGDPGSVAEHR